MYLLFAMLVTSCGFISTTPTPSPPSTDTPIPTHTPLPTSTITPTQTPEFTKTSTPSPTIKPSPTVQAESTEKSACTEKPLDKFQEIPIMPGAISGCTRGKDGYIFFTKESPQDVKAYYAEKLNASGNMCILNAFNEDEKFAGLMCITPMVIVTTEKIADGETRVTITFSQ